MKRHLLTLQEKIRLIEGLDGSPSIQFEWYPFEHVRMIGKRRIGLDFESFRLNKARRLLYIGIWHMLDLRIGCYISF